MSLLIFLIAVAGAHACLGAAADTLEDASSTSAQGSGLLKPGAVQLPSNKNDRDLLGKHIKVVVVNDIPGHFEVLAGVLTSLSSLGLEPHVIYTGNPKYPASWGLWPWLGMSAPSLKSIGTESASGAMAGAQLELAGKATAQWQPFQMADYKDRPFGTASLVICISPEMAPAVCRAVLEALKPPIAVLWVHRADTATATGKVLQLHPRPKYMALAPHVATLCSTRMHQPVSWALPIASYIPLKHPSSLATSSSSSSKGSVSGPKAGPGDKSATELWTSRLECHERACLSGFAIQGALRKYKSKLSSGYTRNYTSLWARLAAFKHQAAAGKLPVALGKSGGGGFVKVTVLGKGLKHELGIPPALMEDVTHYSRLPYPEFWGIIHRSLALVPNFGMPVYYESRISSTITASLITGTPLIAEQRLLDAYTFLTPRHVFLRVAGEDEAAAMYRVATLPDEEIFSRRRELVKLREELNRASINIFKTWVEEAGA